MTVSDEGKEKSTFPSRRLVLVLGRMAQWQLRMLMHETGKRLQMGHHPVDGAVGDRISLSWHNLVLE